MHNCSTNGMKVLADAEDLALELRNYTLLRLQRIGGSHAPPSGSATAPGASHEVLANVAQCAVSISTDKKLWTDQMKAPHLHHTCHGNRFVGEAPFDPHINAEAIHSCQQQLTALMWGRGFVKQSVSCSKVCLCVIANLNSLQLFSRAFSLVQICQLSPHFPCLQNRET